MTKKDKNTVEKENAVEKENTIEKEKTLNKEGFGGKIRGQFRRVQQNEKVRKASAQIEEAERKFSFPKTIVGSVISIGGGVMLWNHIPFASEVLWGGVGLFVAGIGFKLNRKFLGKEATNKIEKLIIEIIKKGLAK
jgi:hypothetical protein